jgi:hypothetical protein
MGWNGRIETQAKTHDTVPLTICIIFKNLHWFVYLPEGEVVRHPGVGWSHPHQQGVVVHKGVRVV